MSDKNWNRDTALMDIYRVMRPGEPPTVDAALALFEMLFFTLNGMIFRQLVGLK